MFIYQYTTTGSDKKYIGQTVKNDLAKYMRGDISRVNRGGNNKPHLYAAMRKYGLETFTITPLVEVHCPDPLYAKKQLDRLEQDYIKMYGTQDPEKGYNIAAGGSGSFGYTKIVTEEARKNMAASLIGRKHSEETKAKISASNMGKTISQECRAKLREHNLGKKGAVWSDEQRKAASDLRMGIPHSEERRNNVLQGRLKYFEENPGPHPHKSKGGSSKYKGVYFRKDNEKWSAAVVVQKDRFYLGQFPTEKDAAKAHDVEARKRLGHLALLNFPIPGERSALTGELIGTS